MRKKGVNRVYLGNISIWNYKVQQLHALALVDEGFCKHCVQQNIIGFQGIGYC